MTPGDHPVGLYEVGRCEPEDAAGELVVPVEDLADLPALVVGDDAVGRMSSLVDGVELEDLLEVDEARASRAACAAFTG
jgi:Cu-Zn family superoxide dismutase